MRSSAGLLVRDLIRDIWTKPTLVMAPRSPVRLCWNDPILLFFGPQRPASFGAGSGQAPPASESWEQSRGEEGW